MDTVVVCECWTIQVDNLSKQQCLRPSTTTSTPTTEPNVIYNNQHQSSHTITQQLTSIFNQLQQQYNALLHLQQQLQQTVPTSFIHNNSKTTEPTSYNKPSPSTVPTVIYLTTTPTTEPTSSTTTTPTTEPTSSTTTTPTNRAYVIYNKNYAYNKHGLDFERLQQSPTTDAYLHLYNNNSKNTEPTVIYNNQHPTTEYLSSYNQTTTTPTTAEPTFNLQQLKSNTDI
ncbi:uncharacterized protein DDB_G0286175-like [Argopecten irradians]|uniref:uncharacterized protein DDB_G0286175-like n=1 Tax=Argopecten irradians TaxID=31199 RepID=UPI00371F1C48